MNLSSPCRAMSLAACCLLASTTASGQQFKYPLNRAYGDSFEQLERKACPPAGNTRVYEAPTGIPDPPFGIHEQWQDYYTRPSPWTSETPGWYYVDRYHPAASDSNTYGTPDNPRATLPSPIPAGSVVEVHGTYDFAPTGYDIVEALGTVNQPVFIIGSGVITRKWVIKSSYLIMDGLEFTDLGKLNIVMPSHHVVLRNSEMHDLAGKIGGYGLSDSERIHHIVIYNNLLHSQADWNLNPEVDLDNHAIKFGPWSEDVWVLYNSGWNNGGSFIQVGDWGDGSTAALNRARRYYIGRNSLRDNRQSPIGIKQATDIVISENRLYNLYGIQNNASGQSGVVYQYGPERVWIINNHIFNGNAGITGGSNSGGSGQNIYIVGNLIHDLQALDPAGYNTATGWAPAGIMLAGGVNRHIVNNTLYDVPAGINTPADGPMLIRNNIVANVQLGYHTYLETGTAVGASSLHDNLYFQAGGNIQIRLRGQVHTDLASVESSMNASGNIQADPQFVSGDYRLSATSPAVDGGQVDDVYQTFQNLYGLDIRRDLCGNPRPNGAWDMGAIEYTP